jgi:hypothetical protein
LWKRFKNLRRIPHEIVRESLESHRSNAVPLARANIARLNKENRPSASVVSPVKPAHNARLASPIVQAPVIKSGGAILSIRAFILASVIFRSNYRLQTETSSADLSRGSIGLEERAQDFSLSPRAFDLINESLLPPLSSRQRSQR